MIARVHGLPRWVAVVLGILFIAIPFAISFLEGRLTDVIRSGEWRALAEPTVIIVYALAVAPIMLRSQPKIVEGMRPVVQLGDDEYDRLVAKVSRAPLRSELSAIAVGVLGGFIVSRPERLLMEFSALSLCIRALVLVQFGLMFWWIFSAFMNSRVTTALLSQPLEIDIFDLAPFEPIGRQSLILAMLWAGGLTLSILFGYAREEFFSWQTVVVYVVFVSLVLILFVLNMRSTHGVLAETKQRELDDAGQHIVEAYRVMKETAVGGEDTRAVSADVNAWIAMEQRLKVTRTWPYNTEMLRTLFISTLVPLGAGLAKLLGALISSGRL